MIRPTQLEGAVHNTLGELVDVQSRVGLAPVKSAVQTTTTYSQVGWGGPGPGEGGPGGGNHVAIVPMSEDRMGKLATMISGEAKASSQWKSMAKKKKR